MKTQKKTTRPKALQADLSGVKFERNIPIPPRNMGVAGRPRSQLTILVGELLNQEVGTSIRLPKGYTAANVCSRASALGYRGALSVRTMYGDDPHLRVWKVKNMKRQPRNAG